MVDALAISDSVTCGEDVAGNLTRMISLAPEHCRGCADYHVTNAAVRLLDNAPWKHARTALLGALGPIFNELEVRGDAPVDVVVAGCADTAVLSTCVHAAWAVGDKFLRRVRFATFDQCRSPLILCAEYAAQNGLQVYTEALDLTEAPKVFPADVIVIHHLLPFVDEGRLNHLLQTLGSWLKPNGRLVIWHDVATEEDEEPNLVVKVSRIARIKAMVDDGSVTINEAKDRFFSRLDHYVGAISQDPPCLSELEPFKALISSAGLAIRSIDITPHNCPMRTRRYLMVIAGRTEPVADNS